MKKLLICIGLSFQLVGCGSGPNSLGALIDPFYVAPQPAAPTTQTVNGTTYPYGSGFCPVATPRTSASILPAVSNLYIVNTSPWAQASFTQAISDVQAQLNVCSVSWVMNVQLSQAASFLSTLPSEWISDNANPPGLAANGLTYVNPGEETRGGSGFLCYDTVLAEGGNLENYFSHGVLKIASGGDKGPLISQGSTALVSVQTGNTTTMEALDIEANAYATPDGRDVLCDWLFPPGGGYAVTGVWCYDKAGIYPMPTDPAHPSITPTP